MPTTQTLQDQTRIRTYRPQGTCTLVEAVDLISAAIAYCRGEGATLLLVDVTGLNGVPIATLVDRFLMVEEWAQRAEGTLAVAMVAPGAFIHPEKFGVQVATHFGLVCDVYPTEEAALKWLSAQVGPRQID